MGWERMDGERGGSRSVRSWDEIRSWDEFDFMGLSTTKSLSSSLVGSSKDTDSMGTIFKGTQGKGSGGASGFRGRVAEGQCGGDDEVG